MPPTLSPQTTLALVAKAIPGDLLDHLIVIGSLAVAYQFFGNKQDAGVSTKDVDCMLSPNAKAIMVARDVTQRLVQEQWTYRASPEYPEPGTAGMAKEKLPLVRLQPPGGSEWFIELLSPPAPEHKGQAQREFERVETSLGHFALVSFGFFGLLELEPVRVEELGILLANPSMMALCNLLHHPKVGPHMIGGTQEKRSNKDLGRVIALAFLSNEKNPDTLEQWPQQWAEALRLLFAERATELMRGTGSGLQQLLDSPEDLAQALEIVNKGLLARRPMSSQAFKGTGNRLMQEVIAPLKALAGSASA